jgi:putative ABC transport system substrate-binding protein
LAAELVRREVTVIAAVGNASAHAAKAATATIPIVLASSDDPVQLGLVASLNRPGGNVTGVVTMAIELGPKQLELLHELVPAVLTVGALVNPSTPGAAETLERELSAAAGILGLRIKVLRAATEADLHAAFATLVELRAPLVIGADTFFSSRIEQLATLSVSRAVPTIYQYREFAAAGGLMSYGPSRLNTFRQFGVYIGRILAGEKPSDLPIERATKFELVINLKTAKAIGIDVPTTILLRADEVIE